MEGNLLNIFMEHDLYLISYNDFFGIKEKINNFDPYNVLLAIITNIPVLLTTAFEVQVHICAHSDLHFCAFGVFLA